MKQRKKYHSILPITSSSLMHVLVLFFVMTIDAYSVDTRALIKIHVFHADSTPARYSYIAKIIPKGKHLAQRYLNRYESLNRRGNDFEFKLGEGKYDFEIKHEKNKEKIITLNISANQLIDTNIYFEYNEREYSHYEGDKYIIGFNPSKSRNIYGISLNWNNKLESPYNQSIYGLSLTYGRFDKPNFYGNDETGKNIYGLTVGLFENGIDTINAISINLSHRNAFHNIFNFSLFYSKIAYHKGINITPYNNNKRSKYLNIGLINDNYESAGISIGLYNSSKTHDGIAIGLANLSNATFAVGLLNLGPGLNIGTVNVGGSINLGLINFNSTKYEHIFQLPPSFHMTFLNLGLANYMNYKDNYLLSASLFNKFEDNQGLLFGVINNSRSNTGLQFGLLNITDENSGIQFGLLNINNESWMPIINW